MLDLVLLDISKILFPYFLYQYFSIYIPAHSGAIFQTVPLIHASLRNPRQSHIILLSKITHMKMLHLLGLVWKINIAQIVGKSENRNMKRYELTKGQWERIKELLPPERAGKRGRPRKDDRTMLNGMLWIVRSGAQWREMPETYGPWQSVYARFAKWRDDGTLEAIFRALSADADMENLSLDSTCIKVHESANGGGKNGG